MIRVRLLGPGDARVLETVAPGVFDHAVEPGLAVEFLADARHHLAVAMDSGIVVGMASAVHYVHPDKAPELWINEVGVAPTHRRRGLARRLLDALSERGSQLGCREAWVLTEAGNGPARALYESLGSEADETAVLYAWRLGEDR